ncbi:hypothetical protein [Undibacterium sp. TJN19]|uniref:hypothetical protein n=1 Tax=Undibacterium sp. TJN19 TaxID=3413055 RepID=UPI003BF08EE3
MSKLLDYLNALDTNAVLIQAHKSDPLKAATEFGLSEKEQTALFGEGRQGVAAFLDIPFRDFDAIDTIETPFSLDSETACLKHKDEEALAV